MAEPSRGSRTRYLVLGILSRNSATGYQIRQAIQGSTAFFWSESFGQLYPTLSKLTRERLVRRKAVRGSRRGERRYTITEAGLAALRDWLARPYLPAVERNELLLKVFFGGVQDRGVTAAHLRRSLAETREFVATMEGLLALLAQRFPERTQRVFLDAAVRYGQLTGSAHLTWCEETLAALEAGQPRPVPEGPERGE